MPAASPILQVENLCTHFPTKRGVVRAVDGVTMAVGAGETVGVVGESGCGKTTLAQSILRLVPEPGKIVSGRVVLEGRNLLDMDADALRDVRGDVLSLTFQDAMAALDPVRRVGSQLRETMTSHHRFRAEADRRTPELMQAVGVPGGPARVRDYPHQFSGGMRQRIVIAMGIANEPKLLIADEATTALDVTSQAQVVALLNKLNGDLGMAIVLVSHNLAVVAALCRTVVVMYAGRVVEEGPAERIFARPQHPYTWHLLRSVPRLDSPPKQALLTITGGPPDLGRLPEGCKFHPRCRFSVPQCGIDEPPLGEVSGMQRARCWVLMENVAASDRNDGGVRVPPGQPDLSPMAADHAQPPPPALLRLVNITKHFPAAGGRGLVRAVDGVCLDVRQGETLALIGESGCGKSTLARVLTALLRPSSGAVFFDGEDITGLTGKKLRPFRQRVQMVFQNPLGSLNPRLRIGDIVGEPLANLRSDPRADRRRRVEETLDLVGLNRRYADRYPHELSGGQRQRVGIARALVLRPSVIVADEPVSALDASIQAQVVNLLRDLQQQLGLTYVFISHDLAVVRSLADRIAVMYLGKVVELAGNESLYRQPQHPYTVALLNAVPVADPEVQAKRKPDGLPGEPPSPMSPPAGCRFHPRCPIARVPGPCDEHEPQLLAHGEPAQLAACHFAGESRRR